jgi:hypothetical protein
MQPDIARQSISGKDNPCQGYHQKSVSDTTHDKNPLITKETTKSEVAGIARQQ